MLSISMQHETQVDQTFPVHVECMNRRAPGGCLPDNPSGVFAPCKVIAPSLLPRMKQGSRETGFWIDALQFVVFVVITGLAREGQIVEICCAIPAFGDNVFRGERVYCVVLATAAEFTPITCSLRDCLFETAGNGSSSHAVQGLIRA